MVKSSKYLIAIVRRIKAEVESNINSTASNQEHIKLESKPTGKYEQYLNIYGTHFNDKLAGYASSLMVNSNNKRHSWGVEEVKKIWKEAGISLPDTSTWGDATYAMNMAYADYFGLSLDTIDKVVTQSKADIYDIDGYPGKIFNRWMSDVEGKSINIPWKDFM